MTLFIDPKTLKSWLHDGGEIALLDVREHGQYGEAHLFYGIPLPFSRLEIDAPRLVPRRRVRTVVYDEGDGSEVAERAAARLAALGYTDVHVLQGGARAWKAAGYVLFAGVNLPSKTFGELAEEAYHTPRVSADQLAGMLARKDKVVVLDGRPASEFRKMNIPGATCCPNGELAYRVRRLVPDTTTPIVINCAGRTRSIIGTQSLVNAGIPNPVAALRNGTIGWKLAGQVLDHGADRQAPAAVSEAHRAQAQADARRVADKAGVHRIVLDALHTLEAPGRTVYRFDVRTPEEYAAGHLPGFASAPGGQLVQETDHQVPVRGARIVLADDDGVRASMSASWLAQMGWEVYVLDSVPTAADFTETTAPASAYPPVAVAVNEIAPAELAALLKQPGTAVIDVTTSANYVKRHIPGAWYAIRAQLPQAIDTAIPPSSRYVLTCGSSLLARYAAADLRALLDARAQRDAEVLVLAGGNAAWFAAGLEAETGETRLASARTDRYRRPYEGTDAPAEAMQAYLDWEFGLVAQLGRDGTHHFKVI